MTSLQLVSFKKNITDYIESQPLPKEAVRLVLKEILEDVSHKAITEALREAEERENKDAISTEEISR